jgi:CPA2 family monovalent cation:H+ antiporter-2
MFLLSEIDPMVSFITILAVLVIMIGLVLKKFHQPYLIGYILAGAVLGDQGFGLIENHDLIKQLGEIGIILLLFFIGMEISLPELVKQWKVALIGTLFQVLISVIVVMSIGHFYAWSIERSVVLGFVLALSSSAVIIKILQDKHIINSRLGKNILSILLTQDIIIVPLLIITSLLGGRSTPTESIVLMIIGGIGIIAILVYIYVKKSIRLPFSKRIENDKELQLFLAILFCFGGALITSFLNLSAALGAFVGGMAIHVAKSTEWIHDTLHSFRILFVALFFVSIGLQIDFNFLVDNYVQISIILLSVYLINNVINTLILRVFKSSWKEAILGGAYLAQIGELSFLLSFSAYSMNIIGDYSYNFSICLISLTLVISPFWITMTDKAVEYFRVKSITKTSSHVISKKK